MNTENLKTENALNPLDPLPFDPYGRYKRGESIRTYEAFCQYVTWRRYGLTLYDVARRTGNSLRAVKYWSKHFFWKYRYRAILNATRQLALAKLADSAQPIRNSKLKIQNLPDFGARAQTLVQKGAKRCKAQPTAHRWSRSNFNSKPNDRDFFYFVLGAKT
jgi:hypothetical protein